MGLKWDMTEPPSHCVLAIATHALYVCLKPHSHPEIDLYPILQMRKLRLREIK